jgi:hypothetical protein
MQVAETGPWELGIPDGWSFKDHGTTATYLEAPDGTRGCHIKTIELQGQRRAQKRSRSICNACMKRASAMPRLTHGRSSHGEAHKTGSFFALSWTCWTRRAPIVFYRSW